MLLPSEKVSISSIAPASYNPRRISDAAAARLEASLKRFGLVEDVVVNRRSVKRGWPSDSTPTIVGGHQRVNALRAAGEQEVMVKWVDLSETDEKALNITLNNPHLTGEWSDEINNLLQSLKTEESFKDVGLDALLGEVTEIMESGDVHDPNAEPKTKITAEITCPHCNQTFKR